MSINETRREAIINKIKELEEFLEPEGAHLFYISLPVKTSQRKATAYTITVA